MKRYISFVTAAAVILSLYGCGKDKSAVVEPTETPLEDLHTEYTGVMIPTEEAKVYCGGKGEIIECNFAVGDTVKKGDVIYKLDDNGIYDNIKTTENSIKKANLSVQTADENLSNLNIYAAASGVLHDFDIKVGERVNTGTIGKLVNEDIFIVKVPFNEAQIGKISVGATGVITSGDFMADIPVTVTAIYDSKISSSSGSVMREVEFTGQNTGGFSEGLTVDARVETASGTVYSPVSGAVSSADSTPIVSRQSGNAKAVYFKEGQSVKKGDLIAVLENSSLSSAAERAKIDKQNLEIKLSSLEKDAAELTVTAPIAGVITEMTKYIHDSVSSPSSSLMTISDESTLAMDVSVAEDDLSVFNANGLFTIQYDIGSVSAVVESVSEADGTVRLRIENSSHEIKSGTVGTIKLPN